MAEQIRAHPDFEEKFEKNSDAQNRDLALKKIYDEVKLNMRRKEVDFYRYVASDEVNDLSVFNHLRNMVEISGSDYNNTNGLNKDIERIELELRKLISERNVHINDKITEGIENRLSIAARNDPSVSDMSKVPMVKRLSFCDLRELQDIIVTKANWPLFEDVLGNKTTFSSRLDQLAKLRNSIRHSRDISTPILFDGKAAISWFDGFLWKEPVEA